MAHCCKSRLSRSGAAFQSPKLRILITVSLLVRTSGQDCIEQAKVKGQETTSGDLFGGSISISGDTVVSVAPNEDGLGANSSVEEDSGAAYVFIRSGVKWRQQAKLVGNDTAKKHHFGRSVSLSGDSVVIGSRTYEGSAYVFVRSQTTWGPQWNEQGKLMASDKRGGDEFGRSVAISGDLIVVGAPNGNSAVGNYAGAIYIFTRTGSKWVQDTKTWGSDTKAGHYFGDTLAVSDGPSGVTIVVGTDPLSTALGAVYVFTRSAELTWKQQAKLFRSGASGLDHFGASLAIYRDTIVVGAPGDDAAFIDAGAAYIFTRSDSLTWKQVDKVVASDRDEGQRFGSAVSISDSTLAVVAKGVSDVAGNYDGYVYVFAKSRSEAAWSQQTKVAGEASSYVGARFGASVGVSGHYVVSGAPRDKAGGASAGAAFFLKCMTTTTTTSAPDFSVTTRVFATADLADPLKLKAITSGVGSTPWTSTLFALLSLVAVFHHC